MVGQQRRHEGQLGVHPALVKPGGVHAEQAHRHRHRHRHAGGGDDIGQAPLHHRILSLEGRPDWGLQFSCLAVVDEQAYQIKESGEPHHHAYDVEGLEPEVGLRGPGEGQEHRPRTDRRHAKGSARRGRGQRAWAMRWAVAVARIASSSSGGRRSSCLIIRPMRGLARRCAAWRARKSQ